MSDGFFVAVLPADIAVGEMVELTGPEAHHAAVVRRVRVGEVVTLTDGLGRGVAGPVVAAGPGTVTVQVGQVLAAPAHSPRITVVQALPKADRAELAVDLMTEVGVDRIVPWAAARCVTRWAPDKAAKARAKWVAQARESSKQARRLHFPDIGELASTATVAALVATERCFIMHEMATTPLTVEAVAGVDECVIVIGPEGGLTDAEVAAFEAAGGRTYSLGPTVLRTSTAGAVAVSQVRLLAGLA